MVQLVRVVQVVQVSRWLLFVVSHCLSFVVACRLLAVQVVQVVQVARVAWVVRVVLMIKFVNAYGRFTWSKQSN